MLLREAKEILNRNGYRLIDEGVFDTIKGIAKKAYDDVTSVSKDDVIDAASGIKQGTKDIYTGLSAERKLKNVIKKLIASINPNDYGEMESAAIITKNLLKNALEHISVKTSNGKNVAYALGKHKSHKAYVAPHELKSRISKLYANVDKILDGLIKDFDIKKELHAFENGDLTLELT